MAEDGLSEVHFKTVWAEIQGRFFSKKEADQLKEEIDRYTITNPQTRVLGAKAWDAKPRTLIAARGIDGR